MATLTKPQNCFSRQGRKSGRAEQIAIFFPVFSLKHTFFSKEKLENIFSLLGNLITHKHVVAFLFFQENPSLDVFPKPNHSFKKDYKLECIDPKHPSYICVCTIVKVKGARLRLHFDGWSESYDFWTNVDSPFIYPMHWCEKNGQVLHPPRSKYFYLAFCWWQGYSTILLNNQNSF